MTKGLRELQPGDLAAELERAILPILGAQLSTRGDGHCMRVSDLDPDLMKRLCDSLRKRIPAATVVILSDGTLPCVPMDMAVSSTKLVELRNPNPDGTQRPPLLVFVPSGLRAAAEDSFGVATFEEVRLSSVHTHLRDELQKEIPTSIRGSLVEGLRRLSDSASPWPFADDASLVRYLLTAKLNGGDVEAYGGALYELGLVPDFELFAEPAKTPQRLVRNRECVSTLTWSSKSERGRVLELGLKNRAFRNQLGDYLNEIGVEDPRLWARKIVLDQSLWQFAFNRWEFEDGGEEPDCVCIHEVATDLPVLEEERAGEVLDQLIGQQVLPLGSRGLKKFTVSFKVTPAPSQVQGLAKFVAQVVSQTTGPIGLVRGKKTWKSATLQASISFTKLTKIDWEEGWHFIRILPQTEEGDLIPIVDESGNPLPWSANNDLMVRRLNESDLFYVLPGDEVEVDPPQRAIPNDSSVTHALLRLRFSAVGESRDPQNITIGSVMWAEGKTAGRAGDSDELEAKFPREGAVHIPVSRPLKLLEQKILVDPAGPLSWRLPISMGAVGVSTGESHRWPSMPSIVEFLEARCRYFEAILGGARKLITQAADLRVTRHLALDYASKYQHVLRDLNHRAASKNPSEARQAMGDLRSVLAIDSVSLVITDHREHRREAVLVAPTHPLRALWLATWAALGDEWIERSKAAREQLSAARDTLLKHLVPVSFPPVIPTELGSLLGAIEVLNPFWSLYAPTFEDNPRGLVGDVCTALGLPEPAVGGATIDGEYLASRVRRYLIQHPYVQTLVLNAFNAGRGSVLADMLLSLQRTEISSHLRYDITLFVPDPEAPGVGEALATLLSPSASLSGKEADAFATPSVSHLYPKLRLAIRAGREFRQNPEAHPAHLSFMFDVFPAENVSVARTTKEEAYSPIHGLVQDFQTTYREDDSSVTWSRQPRHGIATAFNAGEELTDLLASLAATISSSCATSATGHAGIDLRPVVTLALTSEDRALLHQLHEVSDWVITLDRNLGIEFFDHGGRRDRPEYLIDHSPEGIGVPGHQMVVTSRSIAEIEAMIRPVLKAYSLDAEGRHAAAILEQLRCLSGRMALKLVSSSSQRAEALGLALSRMYLENQGVFENQVVVPLDAHLDLYRPLKIYADEIRDEISFRRTDLALFDLNAAKRLITCRLVEVKCYSQVGDVGAYNKLKELVFEQMRQSEEVLAYHFDPQRSAVDRVDRLVKTRELVTLLQFYLDRAERYGLITRAAAGEARFMLLTLEHGYRLAFTRSALIFDFQRPGTEEPSKEAGVEFHRIGIDLIRKMIESAAPGSTSSTGVFSQRSHPDDNPTPDHGLEKVRRRRELADISRQVSTAAFLGEERDRTVSWEELHAKRALGADQAEDGLAGPGDGIAPVIAIGEPHGDGHESGTASASRESSNAGLHDMQPTDEGVDPEKPSFEGVDAKFDVMLGVTGASPQFGILGDLAGRRVALDLNQTHTISLFGVQGGGKSYTLGTIVEMALLSSPPLNRLPQPLATVIFHYSPTMDYRPEFTSMVHPNEDEHAVTVLRDSYGARVAGLKDIILLVPADKLAERRGEYPELTVHPLKFASSELQTSHWRFLMGAVGNQATYIRQVNRLIKSSRDNLTLDSLREGINASSLPEHLKDLARMRLDLAADYIDDQTRIGSLIAPGRLIIVDLRDEFIEKDEALGLFVVLMQIFAGAKHSGKSFNKLVVFDEAHKYVENDDLVAGLIEVVREMRHKGTSILVASQDPPSVPVPLIELSSQMILHRFNSPAWLKHLQKANAALAGLTPEKMSHLRPGEAYVWASKASDDAFCKGAVKIRLRPRVTFHGGETKTAVERG